jgi:hypothetical protein
LFSVTCLGYHVYIKLSGHFMFCIFSYYGTWLKHSLLNTLRTYWWSFMKKLQLHYRKSVFVNYIIKVLCNLRLDSDLKIYSKKKICLNICTSNIIFSGCQHDFRYWYKQYTIRLRLHFRQDIDRMIFSYFIPFQMLF